MFASKNEYEFLESLKIHLFRFYGPNVKWFDKRPN